MEKQSRQWRRSTDIKVRWHESETFIVAVYAVIAFIVITLAVVVVI